MKSVYGAEVIREIQRRLDEGLTRREVGRQMGISRGTVGAVANGKRLAVDVGPPEDGALQVAVDRVRCGGCGGLLEVMPCLACTALATPKKPTPFSEEESDSLKIGLVDGDRQRYESIPRLPRSVKERLRRQAELESGGLDNEL